LGRSVLVRGVTGAVLTCLLVLTFGPALAAEEPLDIGLIGEGADVYGAGCAACHGRTGLGQGSFPPLAGNPNVADTEYLTDVIMNGRAGPIDINGVVYDGVMPAQSLSEREVEAVVAFIGAGFEVPAVPVDAVAETVSATSGLSGGVVTVLIIVGLALALLGVWRLGPEVVGTVSPETGWPVAWAKAAIIVLFFIGATVVIPSMVLQAGPVTRLPRVAQDLVGSSLWFLGVAGGIALLWWAKRARRI
jgi:mono/diheme cytochrome c family protein